MRKEILILRRNPFDGLTRETDKCDVAAYYCVKFDNLLLRVARKIGIVDLIQLFFGPWKKDVCHYQTIILFDNGYNAAVARYIKRKNPSCRLILWFWNVIFDENMKYLGNRCVDEIWSYDKNDCEKYNLRYNTQFFNDRNINLNNKNEFDVIFVGRKKERGGEIDKVVKEIKNARLNIKVVLPETESERIEYDEYMRLVGKSKSILEIMNKNACGLTLRSLEALFCKKKLITDNIDITRYDFYYPENIFIIGEDDIKDIKRFVNSPYKEVDKKIVRCYEFEKWLDRFNRKEE